MLLPYRFSGGIYKPAEHMLEKFRLFFLVDGKEVPDSLLRREGLIVTGEDRNSYLSPYEIGKLFMGFQGFGLPKFYHSFYFRLRDHGSTVRVAPYTSAFPKTQSPPSSFFFAAQATFLKKDEVLPLLLDPVSRGFLARQNPLPLETLRRLIAVDRSVEREGVRLIRVGKKRKTEEDD